MAYACYVMTSKGGILYNKECQVITDLVTKINKILQIKNE